MTRRQQSGSTTFEGTVETFLDGSEHVIYSFDNGSSSGSWDYTNPDNVSATSRAGALPDFRRDLLGVRCAR